MEEIVFKHCSRCNKSKAVEEFTEPNKLCNLCIEDNREYRRCKKEGVEKTRKKKEPTIPFALRTHYCEVCEYTVRLCKKAQHEQSNYHKDRLRRKEHPEEFENEEKPDRIFFQDGKEYFKCNKCKFGGMLSSQRARHCATLEHQKKNE